jgi:hypothetical protein
VIKCTNLSCAVNVGLVRILALTDHGRSHHLVSIRASDESCSAIEDRGAIMERGLAPSLLRLERALDGLLDQLGRRMGVFRERIFVVEGVLLDLVCFSGDLPKGLLESRTSRGWLDCSRLDRRHWDEL